ncbi:L-arabinose isomerase [Pedobacter westerhofensis]|uniref:L-arabinose isomerase n=1 Tax=Pedobacter westerhofensis TaxID=425512 RepID=A0A521BA23_9SPHI|nr:arabinose isomerase [Pedobacter westerhofensis]SMO43942.1 L-arabinose isomerase [Pedobacter westerhofensis]
MHTKTKVKVGLFGVGLEAYWDQFEGLKSRLSGYLDVIASRLQSLDAEIINLGLIDSPEMAFESGSRFKTEDVDILFLYVSTYALSATVLPVVKKANVPVIVLNLSPASSIDYKTFNRMRDRTRMTGEWLANCSSCAVPEIANVFIRAKIPFYQITGILHDDPLVWQEIEEWVEAARVARIMYYNRLGIMGNYYGGMMDIYTDLTLQCATFGGHMEIVEIDELSHIRETVTEKETSLKLEEILGLFEVQLDCEPAELKRAAVTAVALDKLIEKHKLGALAYYHKGTGNEANENTAASVILGNSILTGKHIPVAGEYEIKNVQAMKIMDSFGAGGSFTEYYAMDFYDDVVLMGHDGPCHPAIAEGKIKVKPLEVYHGKVGSGLSVEMSVKHGAVTLLSVVECGDGTIKLLVAEGESVAGEILEIGNTNSRYKFAVGARKFVESWNSHGPAHHCAVGKGNIASKIKKLGNILKIETIQVC